MKRVTVELEVHGRELRRPGDSEVIGVYRVSPNRRGSEPEWLLPQDASPLKAISALFVAMDEQGVEPELTTPETLTTPEAALERLGELVSDCADQTTGFQAEVHALLGAVREGLT